MYQIKVDTKVSLLVYKGKYLALSMLDKYCLFQEKAK